MPRLTALLAPALLTLATAATAATAHAAPATLEVGTLTLTQCSSRPSYCGHLPRLLDPLGQVPGTVNIFIEYQPRHQASQPSAGLLVAVEGGPGYPSTGSGGGYRLMYGALLETRDLLLVDARGTGRSGVIDCPALQRADAMTEALVAACGRQLGPAAHLYSTRYAADDLAAVLDALAAPKIDLYGDSYGTYFGQTFAYRHGERLRSLVLDSAYPVAPVPGESAWFPTFAPTMRHTFNAVCARSPACAALPGNSMAHIQPAIDLLRAAPFAATTLDSRGKPVAFTADAARLAGTLFPGAAPYAVTREADAAARAFAAGDRLPLLRLMADGPRTQDARDASRDPRYYSVGMFAATTCQDYPQLFDMRAPPKERRRQRDAAVASLQASNPDMYAPFTIDEYRAGVSQDYTGLDSCVGWPTTPPERPVGPPLPANPLLPAVPVLVMNGELDTVTTPPEGHWTAGLFPNATGLLKANNFHIVAVLPWTVDACGAGTLRHFIEHLTPGDTGCFAAVPPIRALPAFYTRALQVPPATAQPGNQASAALLRLAAAAAWTVGDATSRIEVVGSRGVGLRGGSLLTVKAGGAYRIRMKEMRWVQDLAVSGTVRWAPRGGLARASLTLRSDAGVRGSLTLTWPEGVALSQAQISGQLDGKQVRATLPAP